MFKPSLRFMLSPRFFALPLIALAVIFGLAHATSRTSSTSAQVAGPIVRANTCTTVAARANDVLGQILSPPYRPNPGR